MAAKYLNRTWTVDVGDNTSIAIWNGTKTPNVETIICPTYRIKDHIEQRKFMATRFSELLVLYDPLNIYLEDVQMYRGSMLSVNSAASGDLIKLIKLVQTYESTIWFFGAATTHLLLPAIWKGQLTKKATEVRVKMINPELNFKTDHEWDAVAMGYSIMGMLNWRIDKRSLK